MNNNSTNSLLNKKEVQNIISIFKKNNAEIRLVGGCVRNSILKKETNDIDCAVNIKPDTIISILRKNNIKFDDFAKKYGLISTNINNLKFEIASLRKDVNQQGRHTEIIYTNDWSVDAARRDFTINAIYLTREGKIIDYFDGIRDIQNKKIKFIGEIEKRISEDYLRIFRYYRFLGIFQKPTVQDYYENILRKYLSKSFKYIFYRMFD